MSASREFGDELVGAKAALEHLLEAHEHHLRLRAEQPDHYKDWAHPACVALNLAGLSEGLAWMLRKLQTQSLSRETHDQLCRLDAFRREVWEIPPAQIDLPRACRALEVAKAALVGLEVELDGSEARRGDDDLWAFKRANQDADLRNMQSGAIQQKDLLWFKGGKAKRMRIPRSPL